MAEVTIEARPNGPYVVTGTIELRDTNGNVIPTQARTVLCRCGASTKKPFCDGTHSKIGFQAAAQAVPDSAESPADSGKAQQIPALQGYLLETSRCRPQRWTPLNLTESSPASIRPTLKRQKVPVRRGDLQLLS
jgi:CDGSH-type Zn-finger protein